jgi:hypothetical protein
MEFTLDKRWAKGLGTELCVLSTLIDYGVTQLNINEKLNNKSFEMYKNLFNISDDVLKINHTSILENDISPSDLFKVFSPYYKVASSKKEKQYIGLACYDNGFVLDTPGFKYPECKFYSINKYAALYKHLKRHGYEIITLDSRSISLKDKIDLISNFCTCVIGYEGGIAHLCHMLDVPYIMFPWRKPFDSKLLHLDEKTYFLKSLSQILSWNRENLNKCIEDLHNGKSNNELIGNKQLICDRLELHPRSDKEKQFLATK